jgi:malate synthase
MSNRITAGGLQIAEPLYRFLNDEVLPPLEIPPAQFWSGLATILRDLVPINRRLLLKRDRLQAAIDTWYRRNRGAMPSAQEQQAFLESIGYLVPEAGDFAITTSGMDPELATIAGPQLVLPLMNTRFALNGANARWGSLYDAFYGTDALGSRPVDGPYDPERGAMVIARGRALLDAWVPLTEGSHGDVKRYYVVDGTLAAETNTGTVVLADRSIFCGHDGPPEEPSVLVLRHHGLHIRVHIDPAHPVGATDRAGVTDIVLESALTTIMDCEDSVAAVDVHDKVAIYRNWLGLMRGDLCATFEKGGTTIRRQLADDVSFRGPNGARLTLPGRSRMLIRNVGHLMTTDAILTDDGSACPEGILDAAVTAAIGMHDLRRLGRHVNSPAGAIYIVKPKMHGPEEAAFAKMLFDQVEDLLGLPRHTLKLGLMDEERRTSLNLKESIRAVKDRVFFVNTGFLDRTGDEIHTCMEAGPVLRKNDMKTAPWLLAYENNNVDVALGAGFAGRAQIGKGMWAMPDLMAGMLASKRAHPEAGASTAWVPSPTAATLHALHYHQVNVHTRQAELAGRPRRPHAAMLQIPVVAHPTWTADDVRHEIENNVQGILGYVVRWIDHGIGCSKVPDITDVGLMEDRATLRISSQHLANWLRHTVCTPEDVDATLLRMARKVDGQNAALEGYRPMAKRPQESIAFRAARDLIFRGAEQPNGYTEPLLHAHRRRAKART